MLIVRYKDYSLPFIAYCGLLNRHFIPFWEDRRRLLASWLALKIVD